MKPAPHSSLVAAIRRLAAIPEELPDQILLGKFADERDENAFAVLVRRHGGLVLGVGRSILRNEADAEDAFQATFLALAARAGEAGRSSTLAAWLHGTAWQVAMNARRSRERRRAHEARTPVGPDVPPPDLATAEAIAAVHEEVDRLPERYRQAIVLFHLAGRSQEEVGQVLGLSKDGVKKRLERGRERLRAALARRGFGPAAILAAGTASIVAPSAALAEAVTRLAVDSNDSAVNPVSVSHGVWPMSAKSLFETFSILVVAGIVGFGWLRSGPSTQTPHPDVPPAQTKGETPAEGVCELIPIPPREINERAGDVRKDLHGDPLPAGASLRLGTIGFRVPDTAGIGFRATGELVALTEDLRLFSWPANGSSTPVITPLNADPRYGWRRALSPDARFAATFDTKQLTIWDVSRPKPVIYLSEPVVDAYKMAFAANGLMLAVNDTTSQAGTLRLCNLKTKTWATLPIAFGYAESLSFTPDGRWLAVATDRDVIVVDSTTCTVRCRVTVQKVRPRFAALSPDGGTLAVLPTQWVHDRPPELRLLSVPSGERVAGLTSPVGRGHWAGFAPDGKTILLGGPQEIKEWDPAAGKFVSEIPGPATYPGAFSKDGRRLAVHSRDAVFIVDREKGTALWPELIVGGHTESILGVTVSPDGKLIATDSQDANIRVWAADTGRPVCRLNSTSGNDRRVVFLPDSQRIITVADDHVTPTLWDAVTGKEIRRFTVPDEMTRQETTHRLGLSANGHTLTAVTTPISNGLQGYAMEWDVATGKMKNRKERPYDVVEDRLLMAADSPDGRWRVAGVTVERLGSGEKIEVVSRSETGGLGPASRFSPDGQLLAVPRVLSRQDPKQGSLVIFDLETKARMTELPTGRVLRLAFAPDSRTVAVVGREEIAVWEVASGQAVRRFQARHGYSLRQNAISFTPDGRRLINAQDDGTALVWDMTGTGRLTGTGAPVLSVDAMADLWKDLGGSDASKAETAAWELSDRPTAAVSLIRARLNPAAAADPAVVRRLLSKLKSDEFAEREAAAKELRKLGDAALPELRIGLAGTSSAEQKTQIERLLSTTTAPVPPNDERLREIRAVAVLERIGTTEAKEVLTRMSAGLEGARLTREAKAALARLGQK
ncbi:sigma-70 family RNA polymerase sigma factor [Zavarzinella formosa]|uniref:sigma-70 family RNA polymerase sigma factor n=1 Tax=Zavarzinella formosa TaxID=360055 RepID=UPI0002EE31EF|nr:sigma-70 family RNA polymerase sigma factor [Zavarzinella formosa]